MLGKVQRNSVGHGLSENPVRPPSFEQQDRLIAETLATIAEKDNPLSMPTREQRTFAHGLFQYPAMMVPTVQQAVLDVIFDIVPTITNVMDPFVGTGTSLAATMPHGANCFGTDINPLAVLIAKTRLQVSELSDLPECIEMVVTRAHEDTSPLTFPSFPNMSKWFRHDVALKLTRLRRSIQRERSLWHRRFLWVALAETVRLVSNDRTSTYKLHARPNREIVTRELQPLATFTEVALENYHLLNEFVQSLSVHHQILQGRYKGDVQIDLEDARSPGSVSTTDLFDLIITSPPYGDNQSTVTYGQHSYLPLRWVDLQDIDPEVDPTILRTTHEIDKRSLGGKRIWLKNLCKEKKRILSDIPSLKPTLEALETKPRDRAARVLTFCRDLIPALDCIVPQLRWGGIMVWTIGNRHVGGVEIPNVDILTHLLRDRGVKKIVEVGRSIKFKRMANHNGITPTMRRESILVFRRIE